MSMNQDAQFILVLMVAVCIPIFLFGGEPDLQDALIQYFLKK